MHRRTMHKQSANVSDVYAHGNRPSSILGLFLAKLDDLLAIEIRYV